MPVANVVCPYCSKKTDVNLVDPPKSSWSTCKTPCKHCGKDIVAKTYSDGRWKVYRKGEGGCLLTTAACEAKGLPDDCEELNKARRLRESLLEVNQTGKEIVNRYYAVTPALLDEVKNKMNKNERKLYLSEKFDAYVRPACRNMDSNAGKSLDLFLKFVEEVASEMGMDGSDQYFPRLELCE